MVVRVCRLQAAVHFLQPSKSGVLTDRFYNQVTGTYLIVFPRSIVEKVPVTS